MYSINTFEFLSKGDGQRMAAALDEVFVQYRAVQGQFVGGARKK